MESVQSMEAMETVTPSRVAAVTSSTMTARPSGRRPHEQAHGERNLEEPRATQGQPHHLSLFSF
jgi:hypothetical protein